MICVTVGRGRHSSLAEEWKAAAEAGVDLVELRLDCLRRDPDLKRILNHRPTPVVITIRRGVDGGLWRGKDERRMALIREAIALGVDYVDLEMDVAASVRRFGKTKRIVSYHNFKKVPEDLRTIAEQCDEMDADVVKLAVRVGSLAEASTVLRLSQGAAVPTIAIGMGEVGAFTRVLGRKYGAPFTFAAFNPERVFAPGMPVYADLVRDYLYNEIDAATEVYGVIGDPVGQSLSPALHNAAFRHLGLNKVLVPFLVPAADLKGGLQALDWLGLKGFSVTIPHKQGIVKLLARVDGAVERTKACNTVVVEDGKRIGHNTDYRAAMDSLEDALGGRTSEESPSPLMDKQVLILGAGGVARSVAFGLVRRGANVMITARNEEKSTGLAEAVGCRAVNWGQRASTLAEVVVNCTPVGMHPEVNDSPAPPGTFSRSGMIAFDTVYHPENTMFLKLARERDCLTVSGVDMFLHQAAHQFKMYTGQEAPVDLMRGVVRRKLGASRE